MALLKDEETAVFMEELVSVPDYWIGLSKNGTSWLWDDESALTYDRWFTASEPSGDGPCVVDKRDWNHFWNDIYCTIKIDFVCEA